MNEATKAKAEPFVWNEHNICLNPLSYHWQLKECHCEVAVASANDGIWYYGYIIQEKGFSVGCGGMDAGCKREGARACANKRYAINAAIQTAVERFGDGGHHDGPRCRAFVKLLVAEAARILAGADLPPQSQISNPKSKITSPTPAKLAPATHTNSEIPVPGSALGRPGPVLAVDSLPQSLAESAKSSTLQRTIPDGTSEDQETPPTGYRGMPLATRPAGLDYVEPLLDADSPATMLDKLALFIRRAYPECRRAFSAFNDYRFFIGLSLIKARRLIATAAGGNNPKGSNQYRKVDEIATVANSSNRNGLTPDNGSDSKGLTAIVEELRDPHANFTKADAGLLLWIKQEFPAIPQRTLYRYRQWTERSALPALLKARKQLQLPLGDLADMDYLALPEPHRLAVSQVLKTAVDGKDLTQTLRSMEEIPGDPDSFGPQGGDVTPRGPDGRPQKAPKRTKAQIEGDIWRTRAEVWCKTVKDLATEAQTKSCPAGPEKGAHYWDTLDDKALMALRDELHDLHAEIVASVSRRVRRK